MKISTLKNILLVGMALLSFVPHITFAQTPQPYVVLTPLPGTTQTSGCADSNGNTTDKNGNPLQCATLSKYLPGIFNLSIGIAAVMAFVLLTIYGFEYMLSDSLNTKMGAKAGLENVAFGGGLIIFAWLILNTINPALVSGGLNLTTPSITAPASIVSNGTPSGNGVVGYVNTCATQGSTTCNSETADRTILASDTNISVQSACNGTQTSGCTNLTGISTMDMNDTVALQQQCGCNISVTGGTEHQADNTLDMSSSAGLNQFLVGSNTVNVSNLTGPITKQINGQTVTFTYETAGQVSNLAGGGTVTATGNHWHVSFPQ